MSILVLATALIATNEPPGAPPGAQSAVVEASTFTRAADASPGGKQSAVVETSTFTRAADASPGGKLSALVTDALVQARAQPELVVELLSIDEVRGRCTQLTNVMAAGAVSASGRVTLRAHGVTAEGRSCSTFLAAHVRVSALTTVTSDPVRAGDVLDGHVVQQLAEMRGGAPAFVAPPGARATHDLAPGTTVRATDTATGPALGAPIMVVARLGAVELKQTGRVAACPPRSTGTCAVIQGGRRVEGVVDATGTLIMELAR
jgi:hypothetical protein